jgi:probable rRNA maturation factor
MKIQIENRQTKVKTERLKIRETVSRILKYLDCPEKEISILFTDDDMIKEINKQYLGRDKATNVISFSLQEGEFGNINPHVLGDVVISLETAQRDASKGNFSLKQETDFLLIHGILHLLGYDHENTSEEKAEIMRLKEKEIFNRMNRTDTL